MQLDPKAFEAAMKSVEGLPVNGLSYERRVITAYLSALPTPELTEAEVEAVLAEALSMCETYADFIRRVPAANIEEHPYLPELEGVIERLRASRSRPAEAKAGMVKALEWRDLTSPREDGPPEPTGDIEAQTMIGEYSVCIDEDAIEDGGPDWKWCVWSPIENLGHFGDLAEAKAAAQRDYEARILSALEPVAEAKAEPVAWMTRAYDGRRMQRELHLTSIEATTQAEFVNKVCQAEICSVVPLYASPIAQHRDEVIEECARLLESKAAAQSEFQKSAYSRGDDMGGHGHWKAQCELLTVATAIRALKAGSE